MLILEISSSLQGAIQRQSWFHLSLTSGVFECLSRVPVLFHYFFFFSLSLYCACLIVHMEDKLSSLGLINSLLLSYFRTVWKLVTLSYRSTFFHLWFQEKMFTPQAYGKKHPSNHHLASAWKDTDTVNGWKAVQREVHTRWICIA